MTWPSKEVAALLYTWSGWGIVVGLCVGLASTGLNLWMGSVKERYMQAEVKTANLTAEKASESAVTATEKAGVLAKQVEEERGKRARLEQELASRHVSKKSSATIEPQELQGAHVQVMELADGEAEEYGDEIARLLRSAGATVDVGKGNVIIPPPVGVRVAFNHHNPLSTAVYEVLKKAAINPIDDRDIADSDIVFIRVGVKARTL